LQTYIEAVRNNVAMRCCTIATVQYVKYHNSSSL